MLKRLLSDKIMNGCLVHCFGAEVENSKNADAIIQYGNLAFTMGRQIRFQSSALIQRAKDDDLRTITATVLV